MNYWDEMDDKYGFNDGCAVPVGAEKYRRVYVQAVNAIAEALGSSLRCYAYDRPGVHNWCLILFDTAEHVAELGQAALYGSGYYPDVDLEKDGPMKRAIEEAMGAGLDSLVTCRVSVPKGASDNIARLAKSIKRK